MAVQSVQDNGSVKGTLDLDDHVAVSRGGESTTITIKDYLSYVSNYDDSESPNERLAHVLGQASRLPFSSDIINFVNNQTKIWDKNHPAAVASSDESKPGQCSQGTTLVAAGNFCIDNEATRKVKGQYPTWSEAKGFCEAAGKFLLTYEQQRLGANSLVVEDSGCWEWVLKSNGDNSEGQVGGFFDDDNDRHSSDGYLYHVDPGERYGYVAFRCGGFPSPQD